MISYMINHMINQVISQMIIQLINQLIKNMINLLINHIMSQHINHGKLISFIRHLKYLEAQNYPNLARYISEENFIFN